MSVIDIRSQEHFEQLLRSTKVVLADFWFEGCQPCRVISPVFEKLAQQWARPDSIAFAKINRDSQANLVRMHNVSSYPTIVLFEAGKETERVIGADVTALAKLTERFAEIATKGWKRNPPARGYVDVTNQVDMRGSELLNADTIFGGVSTLFSDEKPSGGSRLGKGKEPAALDWIESDTDAQLMLFAPFQSTIKLHSIEVTSFAKRDEDDDDDVPARPRRVELYTNRPHNLGFEEAEGTPAVQAIELTPASWRAEEGGGATAVIETRFVKFQNVSSLVIFVVDAEYDAERTRIDRIRLVGELGERKVMGKLQKVGEEE